MNALPMGLFAYGSLMFLPVIGKLWPKVPQGELATLRGYRRASLKNRLYPGLVAKSSAACEGLFFHHVPQAALEKLDAFEGAEYTRISVPIVLDGVSLSAWTYLLEESARHLVLDQDWDAAQFQRDHLANFLSELSL